MACILALPAAATLDAATIDVKVTSPTGAAVPDAVVYALPVAKAVLVGHKVATMDQKNRVFVPHILPIQTGTWVEFPNSDDIRHQVYSVSPVKKFQLPLYKGKPAFPIQFNAAGVVVLGCNIHDWMIGYVYVSESPYFAKTGANGKARITNLPPRAYIVRVWHPQAETQEEATRKTIDAAARTVEVEWMLKVKPERGCAERRPGRALLIQSPSLPTALLKAADMAGHAPKRNGRNRATMAAPPGSASPAG